MNINLSPEKLLILFAALLPSIAFMGVVNLFGDISAAYMIVIETIILVGLTISAWGQRALQPLHKRKIDKITYLYAAAAFAFFLALHFGGMMLIEKISRDNLPILLEQNIGSMDDLKQSIYKGISSNLTLLFWGQLILLKALFIYFWVNPIKMSWPYITLLAFPLLMLIAARSSSFMFPLFIGG